MPPPYVTPALPGIRRKIVLDGQVITIVPPSVELFPEAVVDHQDMMDGTTRDWERRPYFDGVVDKDKRYSLTLKLEQIEAPDRMIVEEASLRSGLRLLTVWRPVPMLWTCKAGTQRYYLPKLRRCAAHVYDGLHLGEAVFANVANFPSTITLNGDALAVTYAVGPTLADPGAGGIVVAKNPDTSGDAKEYVGMLLGDAVATGDELKAWMCVTLQCRMRSAPITVDGVTESHAYTFVEL